MLQKIMLFLCSNIGSITSPNSIGNVLSNDGIKSLYLIDWLLS